MYICVSLCICVVCLCVCLYVSVCMCCVCMSVCVHVYLCTSVSVLMSVSVWWGMNLGDTYFSKLPGSLKHHFYYVDKSEC